MKTGIIVTGLVAAALVIGGFIIINNKSDNNQTSTTSTTNKQPETATNTSETQTPQSASAITYANSSFTPSSLTVKSGDSVSIKNNSDDAIQVQSNPHPVHTDNDELNVGVIQAGKTATFTLTKTGTFGYHNHLNSSETGTITVQ